MPGVEPGTSSMLRKHHTARPHARINKLSILCTYQSVIPSFKFLTIYLILSFSSLLQVSYVSKPITTLHSVHIQDALPKSTWYKLLAKIFRDTTSEPCDKLIIHSNGILELWRLYHIYTLGSFSTLNTNYPSGTQASMDEELETICQTAASA